MTAQIPDRLLYEEEEWDLAGVDGDALPRPEDFGMVAAPLHSACWRGYEAVYALREKQLVLQELTLNPEDGKARAIGGKMPEGDVPFLWSDLQLPLSFSGRLIVGRDFIDEEYIHMGFQGASCYERVLEFRFEQGIVQGIRDCSAEYKARRGNLQKQYLADPFGTIDRSFSLDPDKDSNDNP